MDVTSFLTGNFLTHLDLPQPQQVWTIQQANQQLVGSDQKICVNFSEYPAKPLGCNKTNLKRIVSLYGLDASAWIGQQLLVYRSTTAYGGKSMQCVRVVGPQQQPLDDNDMPTQAVALQSAAPAAQPAVQQPVVAPVQQQAVAAPAQQPVAAPQANPWEADQGAVQQNSPPSA